MRSRFRIRLLFTLMLVVRSAVSQEAVPAAESLEWRVTYEGAAECRDCGLEQAFRIGVERQAGGPGRELRLQSIATRLTGLHIYKDLAIVRGDMPYGGDHVAVLDLVSGEVLASIPAYGLQISPDNRYLIYQKWYPRFGEHNEVAAMIHDLALHDVGRDRPPAGAVVADGFRFFPEQITYENRDAENPVYVLTGNGVLWNLARKNAFVTMVDASGYNTLLVLPLWEGAITADYPPLCMIPLMPMHSEAEYARGNRRRNMVVGMTGDADGIVVRMARADGVDTDIRVDPEAQCR